MNKKPFAKNKPKQPDVKRKSAIKSNASQETSWIKYILLAVILIVTYIAFSPAFKGNFVNWDDQRYVLDNTMLSKPLQECAKYYFSHFFFNNYHPLTMMVYAMEFHNALPVQGFITNPDIFHEVNIIIHLLNVMLVFWFVFLLSEGKLEVAVIVSLLFGIHPMHVESVAWVSELKDCLYSFFFILGLIFYYKYIKDSRDNKNKSMSYFLAFLMFILSGLSKPAAVTFILVLPLIDYYLKRKINKWIFLEKIPFFLLSLVLGIVTIKAQEGAIGKFELYTFFQRIMLASYALISYIYKLFLPINQSALYPFTHLLGGNFPIIFYIAPFIVILIFAIVLWSTKYTRIVAFGFLFFVLNIFLILQFMSVGISLISERYTYIPYIGLFFIAGMGFSWIYRNKKNEIAKYRSLVIGVFIVIGTTCAFLTNARCKVWLNAETMWTDVIKQFPNDPEGYQNRGLYLVEKAKYGGTPEKDDMDKAFQDFNHSLILSSKEPKIYSNLGNIYALRGNYDSSLAAYNKAVAMDSTDYNVYLNRGITYSIMQKYDSSFVDWDKALRLHGPDVKIYQNRAFAYLNKGRFKESIQDYKSLNEMGIPLDGNMYFFLACDYFQLGNYDSAIIDFTKAIDLNPNNKEAYFNRSQTYNNMKRSRNALDDALKAQSLGYNVYPAYLEKLRKQL